MTKNYAAHVFSLCALFVLSSVMTNYSFDSLLDVAVAFGLIFLSTVLINLTQNKTGVFLVLNLVILLSAIGGAIVAFLDFFTFVKSVLLPQSSHVFILVASILIVFIILKSRSEALLKYSLLTAVICGVVIAVCFILSIKNFDFSDFTNSYSKKISWGEVITIFSFVSLPFFVKDKSPNSKPILLGSFTGFLLAAVCYLQSVFILGKTDDITLSYLRAVSAISTGSLFTRLDGLVYFLFFVTFIIKIAVCAKVVLKSAISCFKNAIAT